MLVFLCLSAAVVTIAVFYEIGEINRELDRRVVLAKWKERRDLDGDGPIPPQLGR